MSMGIPPEILRLTTYAFPVRLETPMGTAERRSPICGSRVAVDVDIDDAGRVSVLGMRVNACAFGQAASAILAQGIVARTTDEIVAARDALAAWIAGTGAMPEWPDIAHLQPERLNSVRKASVQLAFQAAADAALAAAAAAKAPSDA